MRSGRWQRWINSFWLLALSLAFAASTSGKLQPGAGYLSFLPIRKTTPNPTVHKMMKMIRRKWASLAFCGIGTDSNGG
jgi:hypothetical protein